MSVSSDLNKFSHSEAFYLWSFVKDTFGVDVRSLDAKQKLMIEDGVAAFINHIADERQYNRVPALNELEVFVTDIDANVNIIKDSVCSMEKIAEDNENCDPFTISALKVLQDKINDVGFDLSSVNSELSHIRFRME